MKTTKYTLVVALGLAGITPQVARADTVDVTISNLTFNGASACGGTCTQRLDATFQWDNTSNSLVPGSVSFASSGALGTSWSLTLGPKLVPQTTIPDDVATEFTDASGDEIGIFLFETGSELATGPYFANNVPTSQTDITFLSCSGTTCSTDFPSFANNIRASSGTITVTAPEPSSLLLLGTGLLGLMCRRKRLA